MDFLIQVKILFFHVDLCILNMEHDSLTNSTPIIPGKPFMKTIRTKMNEDIGTFTIEFKGDIVSFDILDVVSSLTFDPSLCVC